MYSIENSLDEMDKLLEDPGYEDIGLPDNDPVEEITHINDTWACIIRLMEGIMLTYAQNLTNKTKRLSDWTKQINPIIWKYHMKIFKLQSLFNKKRHTLEENKIKTEESIIQIQRYKDLDKMTDEIFIASENFTQLSQGALNEFKFRVGPFNNRKEVSIKRRFKVIARPA